MNALRIWWLLVCLAGALLANAISLSLDITKGANPAGGTFTATAYLPATDPRNTPDLVYRAIQERLDYLRGTNGGTLTLPVGVWNIDKPVQLYSYVSLLGAGQTETTLAAAPGYRGMPMVIGGEFFGKPVTTECRVNLAERLGDPAWQGRYGLRTLVQDTPRCVAFYGDPITQGGLDPLTKRATYWTRLNKFTLEMAFYYNPTATPATGMENTNLFSIGHPQFNYFGIRLFTNAAGLNLSCAFRDVNKRQQGIPLYSTPGVTAHGLYHVIVQFDGTEKTVESWVKGPADAQFRYMNGELAPKTVSLPLMDSQEGMAYLGPNVDGSLGKATYQANPASDCTMCGLHLANDLRYYYGTAQEPLLRRDTQAAPDSRYQYFTTEPSTIAYLPLTDHPADDVEAAQTGMLVTVQHGPAAGDGAEKGYALFVSKAREVMCGVVNHDMSLAEMTIQAGPLWGCGFLNVPCNLDPHFWNLTIKPGGYAAFGMKLPGAVSYSFDIRHATLAGSHAPIDCVQNIIYLEDLNLHCGRYAIAGNSPALTGARLTLRDAGEKQTESYFHLIGGNIDFRDVRGVGGSEQYPSFAVVDYIPWGGDVMLKGVYQHWNIDGLGPKAAFFDLKHSSFANWNNVYMLGCAYTGKTDIDAFLRGDMTDLVGYCYNCPPTSNVKSWIKWQNPTELPTELPTAWKDGASYKNGEFVEGEKHGIYRCYFPHTADQRSRPGAKDWGWVNYWTWTGFNVWTANTNYSPADYAARDVLYNKTVYRCVLAHTATDGNAPDSVQGTTYWKSVNCKLNFIQHVPAEAVKSVRIGPNTPDRLVQHLLNQPAGQATERWNGPNGMTAGKPQIPGTAPRVIDLTITYPTDGLQPGDQLIIAATATDTDANQQTGGIDHIDFFVDKDEQPGVWEETPFDRVELCGAYAGTPATYKAAILWQYDGKPHMFKAVAYDRTWRTSSNEPVATVNIMATDLTGKAQR